MSRRRKRKERDVSKTTTLEAFLGAVKEEKKESVAPARVEKKVEVAEREEVAKPSATDVTLGGIEREVLSYIETRGKIKKSELYSWAKLKGLKLSDVYKALHKLIASGLIERRLDGSSGELVYVYKGG